MPHAKPTFCSLFGPSGPGLQRTQTGVTELIVDIVDAANRTANAKQALNQMFDGNGKATGAYQYGGLPVWHASSGNGQQSVCLFYTMNGFTAQVLAIGEHKTSTSYKLEWGPTPGAFSKNATIQLAN
jgi:hypothetical protein